MLRLINAGFRTHRISRDVPYVCFWRRGLFPHLIGAKLPPHESICYSMNDGDEEKTPLLPPLPPPLPQPLPPPLPQPLPPHTLVRMTMKSTGRVLGHSLLPSLKHASLARSAALIRSLARSLAHSGAHGKEVFVYELSASISYSFSPLWGPEIRERMSPATGPDSWTRIAWR